MDEKILTFPCAISIKAMGKNQADFDSHVAQIVRKFCPDLSEVAVTTRISNNKNYLAVTVKIIAQSRQQADDIYRALSQDKKVLMAI